VPINVHQISSSEIAEFVNRTYRDHWEFAIDALYVTIDSDRIQKDFRRISRLCRLCNSLLIGTKQLAGKNMNRIKRFVIVACTTPLITISVFPTISAASDESPSTLGNVRQRPLSIGVLNRMTAALCSIGV